MTGREGMEFVFRAKSGDWLLKGYSVFVYIAKVYCEVTY